MKLNSVRRTSKSGVMTLAKFNLSHACGCAHIGAVLCLFFHFTIKVSNSVSYSALRNSDVASNSWNTGLVISLVLDIAPEEKSRVSGLEKAPHGGCVMAQAVSHVLLT